MKAKNQNGKDDDEAIVLPLTPKFLTTNLDDNINDSQFKIPPELKSQILALTINDNIQQSDFSEKQGIETLQFLIAQLATVLTYSKKKEVDDDFNEKEKQNYAAFLSILNNCDYDKENASQSVIDQIKAKYNEEELK